MLMLISQDGLKAIDAAKISFYVIEPKANDKDKFALLAKTPDIDGNFYDYLILFEHEDIETVKNVMNFLILFQSICHDDCILNVTKPEIDKIALEMYKSFSKVKSE